MNNESLSESTKTSDGVVPQQWSGWLAAVREAIKGDAAGVIELNCKLTDDVVERFLHHPSLRECHVAAGLPGAQREGYRVEEVLERVIKP